MTDYAPITDPANPFATAGLSREVRCILDCLLWARSGGLDVVATSTTDHSKYTSSGNLSRHCMDGTDGKGLGVDCRMRRRGNGIHRAVFDLWVPVEHRLHELIYADAPYNIRRGERVYPYAMSSHYDHVHLSVGKGVFLELPGMSAPTPQEAMMRVPNAVAAVRSHDGHGVWVVDRAGAVFAFRCHYHGAYNTHPEWGAGTDARECIGIERNLREGYDLLFDDGAIYSLPV